ncbi:MAG: hypothetical protein A2051_05350 [Desulfovibrionales bacterium GWA2_65_9]|nr:MAG: hypothetical protein A2051_05350 [Desulfovibrionales bacterium GWA2_65_9]
MLKRLALAAILCGLLCQPALADDLTPAKRADINRLMETTGSASLGMQIAEAFSTNAIKRIKANQPLVSDSTLNVLHKEIMGFMAEKMSAPGGIMDMIVTIYAKHLTHQDIRDILVFYETPVGKKTIRIMPQVMQETIQESEKLAKSFGPEMEQRIRVALKREGVQLKGDQ